MAVSIANYPVLNTQMFNINKTTKSLLLALVMVVAVTGGAVAAAPTVNTETTDTTYTTDIEDGGTQEYNATTTTNFSWSADSANSKIVIEQDGEQLYSATPEHDDEASGTYYYNASIADDGSDYSGLDADAGESVDLNVTLINNTEVDSPDETNVSWTFANSNEIAFEDVDGNSVVGPAEDGGILSNVFGSSDDETDPAKADTSVGIVGNETETVTVSIAGTPMAEAMDASAEATESGDVMWGSASSLSGQYLALANGEAPDTDWFNDSAAYVTYDADAQTLTYHNVDESVDEDAEEVELSATGNDGLGLMNTVSMLNNYDAGWGVYGTAAWNADWNEPSWEDEE